jgi:hypothetical protein
LRDNSLIPEKKQPVPPTRAMDSTGWKKRLVSIGHAQWQCRYISYGDEAGWWARALHPARSVERCLRKEKIQRRGRHPAKVFV